MRFHLDEHIPDAVATALRRQSIDVTTTAEVGLRGADDIDHIELARKSCRVIVTCDSDFLQLAASGEEHCGIVFFAGSRGIGKMIDFLVLLNGCLEETAMRNHIEFG